MHELGYITSEQDSQAINENLFVFTTSGTDLRATFVMYVRDLLIQKYGLLMVEKGGLTVKTSLDLKTQLKAEANSKK